MGQYSYQKRPAQTAQTAQPSAANLSRIGAGVPNSVLCAMKGVSNMGLPGLKERMRVRTQALRRQIPAAEQEADHLSEGVTSESMEEVKSEMGRRLNADFSGVRLHTDAAAADRADKMGAAAYTSGKDIYFGSGGFQPDTAAHELVHTVQQGAVVGGPTVQSVPMGTVQMAPPDSQSELEQPESADAEKDYAKTLNQLVPYFTEGGVTKREGVSAEEQARNAKNEIAAMDAVSNFISKYGQSDDKRIQSYCAKLEEVLLDITQKGGQQEDAVNRIKNLMENLKDTTDPRTNQTISSTGAKNAMDLLKQGVQSGKLAGDKQMSPALQAILIETMASQDEATTARTSAQAGTHITGDTSSRLHVTSSNNPDDLMQDAAGIFHESTHAQNYKLYGSILSAPASEVTNRNKMEPRMRVRLNEAHQLEEAGYLEYSHLAPMGVGGNKLIYGRHGDASQDTYLTNAINGFTKESETLGENDRVRGLIGKQIDDLNTFSAFHSDDVKDAYTPFSNKSTAIMAEHDPVLNEILYRFESSSDDEMRKNSKYYRILKAAAIRAHAERHNAALRKKYNLPDPPPTAP